MAEKQISDLAVRVEKLNMDADTQVTARFDKLAARIKAEEMSRTNMYQELLMALDQREAKVNQKIETDIREETTARQTIVGDTSKLSEQLKDMKIRLHDECSRCQSMLATFQTKVFTQFTELNEHLNAERTARERTITAMNNDLSHKFLDVKNVLESQFYESSKEMKGSINKLSFLCEGLRQDLELNKNNQEKLVEAAEKRVNKSLADYAVEANASMNAIKVEAHTKATRITANLEELRELINQEAGNRERAFQSALDIIAQEHYKREHDEAAIVAVIESFICNVRDGCLEHHTNPPH